MDINIRKMVTCFFLLHFIIAVIVNLWFLISFGQLLEWWHIFLYIDSLVMSFFVVLMAYWLWEDDERLRTRPDEYMVSDMIKVQIDQLEKKLLQKEREGDRDTTD